MIDNRVAIEFDNVSFEIAEGKKLLVDLNLRIDRGETVVLLGRSGSGKTTTMKMINRLLDADFRRSAGRGNLNRSLGSHNFTATDRVRYSGDWLISSSNH